MNKLLYLSVVYKIHRRVFILSDATFAIIDSTAGLIKGLVEN